PRLQRAVALRPAGLHRRAVAGAAVSGTAVDGLPPVLPAVPLPAAAPGVPRRPLPALAARPARRHHRGGVQRADVAARPLPPGGPAARLAASAAAAAAAAP